MAGIEEFIKAAQLAQAAGSVASGYGAMQQGNYNANLLNTQARQVAANTNLEEAALRAQQRQEQARQIASVGSLGIAPTGSVIDVIRQNAVNAEMDALTLRYRGAIEAAGYRSQAKMSKYEGRQALYSGIAGAGTKLLTSFGEDLRMQRRSTGPRIAAPSTSRAENPVLYIG